MMKKSTNGAGSIKATEIKDSMKSKAKLEKGKDLRQNPSGGTKAKGSI